MPKNDEEVIIFFNWKEFACGFGAAFINVSLMYPMYKLLVRQMINGTMASVAFKRLRNEGILMLYRGVLPPLFDRTLSFAIKFGVYAEILKPLHSRHVNDVQAKVVAAVVSGLASSVLVPFQRVQVLLISSHYYDQFKNTWHVFKVLRQYGYKEYYRGMVPTVAQACIGNVGFFIIKDKMQSRMPMVHADLESILVEFTSGALIGVLMSTICYPIGLIKVNMQSKLGGKFETMTYVTKQMYLTRGLTLRRGLITNAVRSFLSWGIMNAAYEEIKYFLD